jgi:hypothetical protein
LSFIRDAVARSLAAITLITLSFATVAQAHIMGQGQKTAPGQGSDMMDGGWGWGWGMGHGGYGMGGFGGAGILVLALVVLGVAVVAFRRRRGP